MLSLEKKPPKGLKRRKQCRAHDLGKKKKATDIEEPEETRKAVVVTKDTTQATQEAAQVSQEIGKVFQEAVQEGAQAALVAQEALKARLEAGQEAGLDIGQEAMQEASKATQEASKATQKAAKATQEATKAAQEVVKATQEATKATQEATKTMQEAMKATQEAVKATQWEIEAKKAPARRVCGLELYLSANYSSKLHSKMDESGFTLAFVSNLDALVDFIVEGAMFSKKMVICLHGEPKIYNQILWANHGLHISTKIRFKSGVEGNLARGGRIMLDSKYRIPPHRCYEC